MTGPAGPDRTVFSPSPPISMPGKITVVQTERRDCICGHGIAQHARRQWDQVGTVRVASLGVIAHQSSLRRANL